MVPLGDDVNPGLSVANLAKYHISIGTPDYKSLMYKGGKDEWRDKKQLIEGYLSDKQPVVAAIFDGSLTEDMLAGAPDHEKIQYQLANRALASFLMRIICPDKGEALTKAILAKIRNKTMPDKMGDEITAYLDERALFVSEADQREALNKLNKMIMKSTMSREQIETFSVDLQDLHERCSPVDKMQQGSISTLLASKIPSDLSDEAKQLRTSMAFMNTFSQVQPDYDSLVQLIADLILNARLDGQEKKQVATTLTASGDARDDEIRRLRDELSATRAQAHLGAATPRRAAPPPTGKDKQCMNCGSKAHEHPECTKAPCSSCGKRWCGALRGLPCAVKAQPAVHETRLDVYGREPSSNYKSMVERARNKPTATANVASLPAECEDELNDMYDAVQLGPPRTVPSAISFNFVAASKLSHICTGGADVCTPLGGVDLGKFIEAEAETDLLPPVTTLAIYDPSENFAVKFTKNSISLTSTTDPPRIPFGMTADGLDVTQAIGRHTKATADTYDDTQKDGRETKAPSDTYDGDVGSRYTKVPETRIHDDGVNGRYTKAFDSLILNARIPVALPSSVGGLVVQEPQVMHVNAVRTVPLLLDSGASDTVFCSEELYRGSKILASAHTTIGVGNAAHPVAVKGEARPVLLLCGKDVLVPLPVYALIAPAFARDVASTGQLFDVCGARSKMDDVLQLTLPSGQSVPIRREASRLFVVDVAIPTDTQAHALVVQAVRADEGVLLWHARMCLAPRSAARFIEGTVGHGLTRISPAALRTIEECSVRKGAMQKAEPTHSTSALLRAQQPGERLVFDGWGPYSTPSIATGHTYVMVSGDEFTSFPAAASTVLHRCEQWLSFVDANVIFYTKHGWTVKTVRADGAGEFNADAWAVGLKERKLSREKSAPHEKDGVGLAECIIRLASEKTRAFMLRAGVNKGFVVDAFLYAIHVLKFIVRHGDTCCKYAAVTGTHSAALKRLKTFACVMDGRVSPDVRDDKAAPVTRRGIFIGISDGHYRLFAAGKEWLVQNDATFYEGGMLRVGLAPKQLLVDSAMQTDNATDAPADEPDEPTARNDPDLQRPPSDVGGPRPDGGRFQMRARAIAALAQYDASCQQQMGEMRSARDASRVFTYLACADPLSSTVADEDNTSSTTTTSAYVAAVKGGRMVSLLGPQGAYSMFEPKGHSNARQSPNAPEWRTAEEVHLVGISKRGRVTVVPRGTASGFTIYRGHWVYTIKVQKESGWLEKLKARFVVDGSSWDCDWDCFSGATPDEYVFIVIGYGAVHRRISFKFDLADAYQTQEWPDGQPRFSEMPPGHVDYDADGQPMLLQYNMAFWGFPPSGNILDVKMQSVWREMGAREICSAPRLYTLQRANDIAHVVSHVDDGLVTQDSMDTAKYIIEKLREAFGGEHSVKVQFTPESYKSMSLAYSPGVVTLRVTQMAVDVVARRAPQLLSLPQITAMPRAAERLIQELRDYVRPLPLPPLTKEQKTAQQWIGEVKYLDTVIIHVKYVVHELTRHMSYPPVPTATTLLTYCSHLLLSAADDGITFGGSSVHAQLPLECHAHSLDPSLAPSPLELSDLVELAEFDPDEAAGIAAERGLSPAAREWAKINCKGAIQPLVAPDLDDEASALLEGQCDATWQTPPVKSVSGMVVTLFGAAILISVTCIPAVMHASFNAELYAAVQLAHRIVSLRLGCTELGLRLVAPTDVWGDNSGVIALSRPGSMPAKSKGDARRIGILQDYVREAELRVGKIHTKMNASDYLGKLIESEKFVRTVAFLTNRAHAVPAKVSLKEMIAVAIAMTTAQSPP